MDAVQVLHVDDDELVCELTASVLGEADDITVEWVTDPTTAMEWIDGGVDCVVSDYDMPRMDGLELLQRVRERHPELPFLLFTGKGSEEIASDAISAGVTDYLQKGTGTEQYELLATRIRNAVSGYRAESDLAESKRRIRTLLCNLPGMSYRCLNEPEWPMEFVSEGCKQLTGYEPDELESGGMVWGRDLIDERDADRLWDEVQDAIAETNPYELVYRIRTRTGDLKWVWEQGRGVFEDGDLVALEGIIMDVTDYEDPSGDVERPRKFDARVASRIEAEIETAREAITALDDADEESRTRALDALERATERLADARSASETAGE
ncbi:response regulator [Haloarculaceae archaeon H-GB2-1]|nr:response regulator [Haloarculaceae archaeon H-GB1-1]MEA5387605.1 response regulator [Haloarculaceae archaeon H-GB11]MEA5409091.1 response regulator [Haloarculaceae archaeon H-GB2-1]